MTEPDATWIRRLDPDRDPRARADGIRLAVKDCIDVAGVPTTAGNPLVAERSEAQSPARDAACLAGARTAGARIVGKANLHELCFGSTGVNPWFGTPRNPRAGDRIPGGSSSGSAVAVATGEADLAYGTDTAGSIRNPAACCGVVGLKTTWGRIPLAGVWPLAPSMDTVGVLAPTVRGAALGMTLLEPGFPGADATAGPARRIGRFPLPGADPATDDALDAALAAAGFEVVPVDLPGFEPASDAGRRLLFAEARVAANDAGLWPLHRDRLGPDLVARYTEAETIGSLQVADARAQQAAWRAELGARFAEVDVIALPALPGPPPRIGEHGAQPNHAAVAVSLAGNPAVALPVPWPEGGGSDPVPPSLQLVGPARGEARLLATAAVVERAVGSP